MKYCCEHCGKSFVKEEEAIACEKQHKAEQERNEKLKAEKNKRYDEIKCKANELESQSPRYLPRETCAEFQYNMYESQ